VDREGERAIADLPARDPLALVDRRAQQVVAPDDGAQARLQRGAVERPREPDRAGDVEPRVVGREPVQEVQPLLRRRQPEPCPRLTGHQRRAGRGGRRGLERQRAHRRAVEHRAQRQPAAEPALDPRHHLGREQRVTAELEEVVVDPDPGHAEHLGEDLGEQRLGGGRGRGVGEARARRLGLGQRAPVHLGVRGQRQRGERDDGRRDHGVGEPPPRVREDVLLVDARPGPGHDVADQPRAWAVASHRGDRRRHGGVLGQDRLDLAELDPHAADLDLMIEPPQEVQRAVGPLPDQVAGAVQPRAGRRAEAVGHEPLGGQIGATVVAAPEPVAADVQLAGDAVRHQVAGGIADVDLGVGDRQPDRRPVVARLDPRRGRVDRGLGRSVLVPQHAAGAHQCMGELGRERLAPGDHPQAGRGPPPGLEQHAPAGRRGLQDRRGAGVERGAQRGAVGSDRAAGEHDLRARDQRHEQLERRDVERQRRHREQRVARRRAEPGLHVDEQVGEAAVPDGDALGPPRRPRGVDVERDVLGVDRWIGHDAGRDAGRLGDAEPVHRQHGSAARR
jgi:hypothetical protein